MPAYTLDASRSKFTVQAFASGLLSALAHDPLIAIREFTGSLTLSPGSSDKPSIDLSINARSLDPIDMAKAKDRQQVQETMMELLAVARFPTVQYVSSDAALTVLSDSWMRAVFKGNLTLHGVTRPQVVDAQITLVENEVKMSGAFQLLQSSFGIVRPSAAAGLIVAKDELQFKFDIVAGLVPEEARL